METIQEKSVQVLLKENGIDPQTLPKSMLLQLQLSLKWPQESRHPTANAVYATETNIPHVLWKQ